MFKALLTFHDDSSLIFASVMAPLLRGHGADVSILHILPGNGGTGPISERQMTAYLPHGADHSGAASWFHHPGADDFDAVISSHQPLRIRRLMSASRFRSKANRPAFVAFQPGLDFTPLRGHRNRREFDIVFLHSAAHVELFKRSVQRDGRPFAAVGHPYFLSPRKWLGGAPGRRDIYFFAQAVSPHTLAGRCHVLRILTALAARHPDRNVIVKLRHLPEENRRHVHKERLSYPWLLDRYFPDARGTIGFSAVTMRDALDDAAYCITCTSTAAVDAVSAGVPTLVFLDYADARADGLSAPMRREFAESGLIASLDRLMMLDAAPPEQAWLDSRFRTEHELLSALVGAIDAFKAGRSSGGPEETQRSSRIAATSRR